MLRGPVTWVSRAFLVAALLGGSASGAQTSIASAPTCAGTSCVRAGTIRWQELLPGAYVVHDDLRGTEPVSGEPYAAIGGQVAVFGLGRVVRAYDARTGIARWTVHLPDLPPGGQIVSARVWPGVVTVGVSAAPRAGSARATQVETVLSADTGRLIRSFPSTSFGGAVAADTRHTVVVGPGAVTSYDNSSGDGIWSRRTGTAPQRWQLDGRELYMTVAPGGYLSNQPARALRRIDLQAGSERIIRPRSGSFAGTLSAAFDGVVLFTGATGVTAYSGFSGRRLWHVADAVPQTVDLGRQLFYLSVGSRLIGVDPGGAVEFTLPGSPGLYGERDGVAVGLDEGAGGDVWGLDMASQHVIWSASPVRWPHVLVDFSGLGGSADPRSAVIVLLACAQVSLNVRPPQCQRPELVAIDR